MMSSVLYTIKVLYFQLVFSIRQSFCLKEICALIRVAGTALWQSVVQRLLLGCCCWSRAQNWWINSCFENILRGITHKTWTLFAQRTEIGSSCQLWISILFRKLGRCCSLCAVVCCMSSQFVGINPHMINEKFMRKSTGRSVNLREFQMAFSGSESIVFFFSNYTSWWNKV